MLVAREVLLKDINFGDRGRKTYDDIEELAGSISEKGLIQPITVMEDPDENYGYRLIAGGRRFKAHEFLDLSHIDCIIREISGEIDFAEVELMENLQRKEVRWNEQFEMELKLHEMRLSEDPGTPLKDTAAEVDVSTSTLHRHLQMARSLRSIPALGEFDTWKEASRFMAKAQEDIITEELASRVSADQTALADMTTDGTGSQPPGAEGEDLPDAAPEGRDERETRILTGADASYRIGDCIEAMSQMDMKFGFAEVDPPYGIDLKNAKRSQDDQTSLTDYNEVDKKDYAEWLYHLYDEVYQKLEADAFAICWFGPTHHTVTHAAIRHAGFNVNDVPGIWAKGSGQTQQPSHNLANSYEPFFIARKGKAILAIEGVANVFLCKPVPGQSKIHPTQRPTDLIEALLGVFCQPGTTILVPFLGSGATIRAARNQNMVAMGWDLSTNYKNAFLTSMMQDLEKEYAEGTSDSQTPSQPPGSEAGTPGAEGEV